MFDPITSWYTDDSHRHAAQVSARSFGDLDADDLACHLADAQPHRRPLRHLRSATVRWLHRWWAREQGAGTRAEPVAPA